MGRKIAMFKVDDVIIYGKKGVCRIEKTEEKIIDGVKRNYFVLKPVNDSGATIFAPTDNEFFKEAEEILYNEFQYVLQLDSKDELMKYIFSRITVI